MKSVGAAAGGLFMVDEAAANLELTVAVQFPAPLADRYRIIPLSADLPLVDTVKTKTANFLGSLADYVARYPDFAAAHPSIAEQGVRRAAAGAGRALRRGDRARLRYRAQLHPRGVRLPDRARLTSARTRSAQFDANRVSRRGTHGAQRLERLHAFTGALAQTITPAQVVDAVIDLGLAATGARAGGLWLLSPDGTSVVPAGRVGCGAAWWRGRRGSARRRAHTPILDAIRGGVAVWIESRSQLEERYPDAVSEPLGPARRRSRACRCSSRGAASAG